MSTILTTLLGLLLSAVGTMTIAFLKTKRDQYQIDINDAVITQGVRYAEELANTKAKELATGTNHFTQEEITQIVKEEVPKATIAKAYIKEASPGLERSNLDKMIRAKVNELFG